MEPIYSKPDGIEIYNHIKKDIIQILLWALLIGLALTYFQSVDSSDESRWKRSGMTIHRDAATGVEYLSTPNGGLTPRLPKP